MRAAVKHERGGRKYKAREQNKNCIESHSVWTSYIALIVSIEEL